ncbi:MAG: tRNA-dihydrouridine synthase [Pseudolabrys sp.]|nr:tRNA-dihydrouridine synthase [Pseudolabrys sp.]
MTVGRTSLKNPIIAGSAEHLIEASGVQRALHAGVGAVVVKSINESDRGKDQLQRAEYMLLDEEWREIPWMPNAPATAFIACRSGLSPQSFEVWLDQAIKLDREAEAADAYAIASLIVADLAQTIAMAKQVEQAGLRVLELNIGTPYASQAKGVVATELDPERVLSIVSAVRQAVKIPLWVKITGQSERVPELAAAAFRAGGEAVVMAGRLLGFIPDVETLQPFLNTTLGVGGHWNLPLTCHWLAVSRQHLGADKPLIATNGARSGLDVARMMLAGGSAVEMSSQVMLRGTTVLSSALEEFDAYLQRKGMTAAGLVGMAADQRKTFPEMPLRTDNWKKYVAL